MPEASTIDDLTLPAAFLHGWDGQGGAVLAAAREELGAREGSGPRGGVVWLREDLCAVVPDAGDPAVYDVALRVALDLLRLADPAGSSGADGGSPGLGFVVLSGRVTRSGGTLRPESERLLDDLGRRPPELGREPLWATSLAASRLETPRVTGRRRLYDGPSGTRVPILAIGAEDPEAPPWRSPILFRRRVEPVRRPDVERMVAGPGSVEALRVTGPPGCGKTRAIWQALAAEGSPSVWASARPVRHRGPSLAAQLVRVGPGSPGPRDGDPGAAEIAELLPTWLAAQGGGARPSVVLDDLEVASADDLELVRALSEVAVREGTFRLILVHRQGASPDGGPTLPELPEVRVPPMEPEAMEELRKSACKGLSLPGEVAECLLAEAAGHPFAFEEGLAALAEADLIRELHGTLFFRGDRDVSYRPSNRLVQHVEAEVARMGRPEPLRLLALCGEPVPDDRVRAAVRSAGADVGPGWAVPYLEGGMLREAAGPWGPGVALACPAWAEALRAVLPAAPSRRLRRFLGEELADQTSSGAWRTYRMLEGTERAVGPLLSAARDRAAPPGELLAALRTELSLYRASGSRQPEMELELLWALLPLAHRLEGLEESRAELDRAVQLAAGDPRRLVPLAGLQAELAEDAGRLEEAEAILRRALQGGLPDGAEDGAGVEAESKGQSPAQTRALLVLRLARLLIRRERPGEAQELLERVIPILDREEARGLAARARFHLGNVALHQERLDRALDLHSGALAMRRELGKPKPIGVSLSALGRVTLQMGRYTEAVACYREAEEVFLGCGEHEEASFALLGLGRAAARMGDHVGASRPLRRALELRESRGDRTGEAIARLAVAENYLHLGHPATALDEARRAHFDLSLVSARGPLADAEQLLGRVALVQRDLAGAERHLAIALDGHRRVAGGEGAAFDLAYLLEAELQKGEAVQVSRLVSELENALASSPTIERREILEMRLYRGWERLGGGEWSERARPHLERAYRRLMAKTENLPAELRHRFLFQVPEHAEIVRAATDEGLSS